MVGWPGAMAGGKLWSVWASTAMLPPYPCMLPATAVVPGLPGALPSSAAWNAFQGLQPITHPLLHPPASGSPVPTVRRR